MPKNPLKTFINKLRKPLAKTELNRPSTPAFTEFNNNITMQQNSPIHTDLESLMEELKKIKVLLLLLMAEKESFALNIPGAPDPFCEIKNKKAENTTGLLAKDAVNRLNHKTGNIEYLLHRATQDGEYEKCASPIGTSEVSPINYIVREPSEWFVEFKSAEAARVAANPVVSCWIPENNIDLVIGQRHDAVGAWGDMGENPLKGEMRVMVRPGQYAIHTELKKSKIKL